MRALLAIVAIAGFQPSPVLGQSSETSAPIAASSETGELAELFFTAEKKADYEKLMLCERSAILRDRESSFHGFLLQHPGMEEYIIASIRKRPLQGYDATWEGERHALEVSFNGFPKSEVDKVAVFFRSETGKKFLDLLTEQGRAASASPVEPQNIGQCGAMTPDFQATFEKNLNDKDRERLSKFPADSANSLTPGSVLHMVADSYEKIAKDVLHRDTSYVSSAGDEFLKTHPTK